MPDNSAFTGHPWHHYMTGGAASLLQLLAPFLVLGIVCVMVAVARWVAGRVEAYRGRPRPSGATALAVGLPVLASDMERDRTAQLLSHAVGEGRLSLEEADRRIDAVLRSRHRHELEGLVADLPGGAPSPRKAGQGAPRVRLVTIAAAVVLAAIVLQAAAGVWALWPVAVLLLGVVALKPRHLPAASAAASIEGVPQLPWKP